MCNKKDKNNFDYIEFYKNKKTEELIDLLKLIELEIKSRYNKEKLFLGVKK